METLGWRVPPGSAPPSGLPSVWPPAPLTHGPPRGYCTPRGSVALGRLVPVGLWGGEHEGRQAGIVRCLSKPRRQSVLYSCLVSVRQAPVDVSAAPSQTSADLVTDPALAHRHILLAEAHPI